MAYCNQTLAGIQMDCESSMGGIKAVYIANFDDILNLSINKTTGVITGMVMDIVKDKDGKPIEDENGQTQPKKFKPYQFRKQTGSLTSTLNVDETSGLSYVTSELSLVFSRMEFAKRLELVALSKGQLAVIVEDCNGYFHFLGLDNYVSANSGSANTGVNKSDQNAYTLVLSTESKEYPHLMDEGAVNTVCERNTQADRIQVVDK